MNINRHNYEEFFLLLADGELSQAEQDAVSRFTKQHPDLEEELQLLMDCRLDAEVPPIFPKEKLLKPIIWDLEAADEMHNQLLDLLDNELPAAEKLALEQRIAADKALQLEWETLRKHGKLEAEPVPIFPKEKILKPTIWNVDEPDTIFVHMLSLLDGELSPTDKAELQRKIAGDAGLQKEWDALQKHGKLQPETAPVFPKERLWKIAVWNVEQPDPMHTRLLLLVDNELPLAEKKELEKRIATEPFLKMEWNSLQKATLANDTVVFPNKEELYKEKETRRIPAWMRWAAAAILLGAGLYALIPKNGGAGENQDKQMARKGNEPKKERTTRSNQLGVDPDQSSQAPNPLASNTPQTQNETPNNSAHEINSGTDNGSGEKVQTTATINKTNSATNNGVASLTNTKNNKQNSNTSKAHTFVLPKTNENGDDPTFDPSTQAIAKTDVNGERLNPSIKRTIIGNAIEEPNTHTIEPKHLNALSANMAHSNENISFASNPSNIDESTGDDEIVYVAGARINKQKVRGIFRGIARSLGRSFTKSKVEQATPTTGSTRSL